MAVFIACFVAGFAGWGLGMNHGAVERAEIVRSLPETRSAMAALDEEFRKPSAQELVCDQIYDLVQGGAAFDVDVFRGTE